MAYQKPVVQVYQEYARMSISSEDATLYPCVVGPGIHIIDVDEDDLLAYIGDFDETGADDVPYPNNKPGAIVDLTSPVMLLRDPVVKFTATAVVVASVAKNVFTFTALTYPTGVALGDLVDVLDADDADALVISGLKVIAMDAAAFTVTVSRQLSTAPVSAKIVLYREVADIELDADSEFVTVEADGVTLLPVTVEVNEVDKTVVSAKLYIGYTALRQDLSSIIVVSNTNEIEAELGKIVPENPLAYGAMITLANTTTSVRCIGVDSDDVTGYTAAKDLLESYDDVYGIVPLSQKAEIIGIFKAHAQQMSLPEVGRWRCCIANTQMPTEAVLEEGTAGVTSDNDENVLCVLTDVSANFLTNMVDAGHMLEMLDDDGEKYTYVIANVVSEDMIECVATTPFDADAFTDGGTGVTYRVYDIMSKTQQAAAVAAVSTAFGYQRMVHVWPDVCVIDDVDLPGYYLACAVAGMTAGLPSQQGFTRLSCAGIGGLKHAGDYFNDEQLNTIAGGGTFIFMQSAPGAAPAVRHQLTTEMSTIELKEFSFVKNFDYVSMIGRDVLNRFLGKYNITPSTLSTIHTAVDAFLAQKELEVVPMIGPPVLSHKVVSVKQHDLIRDRVEIYVEVWFPYALNTIGLHLVSQ